MANKNYKLIYSIDSAQAEAASKRVNKLLAAGERSAVRLADALGRAYDAGARHATQAADRISTAAVNGSNRATAAYTRAAATQNRIAQGSTTQQIVGLDRLRVAGLRLQDDLVRATERAEMKKLREVERFTQRQWRATKQMLTREEIDRRVHNEKIKQFNDARVTDALRAADLEKEAYGGITESLGALVGSMLGLSEAKNLLTSVVEGYKEAGQYAKEMAEQNLKILDSLREIAFLRGDRAVTNKTAAEQIQLGMQSGLNLADLKEYETGFQSAIYAGKNKGHLQPTEGTPEQLERQVEVLGARVSAAKDIDPRTAAFLTSAVVQSHPVHNIKDVESEVGLTLRNLAEGKGTFSELSEQTLKARGTLEQSGFAGSIADVGALVSTLSLNNSPERISARLESIVTAIVKATTSKASKGKLKDIGITTETKDIGEILTKLAPVIEEAEKPGGPGGIAKLKELGFTNARAMLELYKGLNERGFLKAQLERNRKGMATPAAKEAAANELEGDLDAFSKSIPGQNRLAEAEGVGAEFLRGIPGEQLAIERKRAAAKLISARVIKTSAAEINKKIQERTFGGRLFGMGGKDFEENAIDDEVMRDLLAQARAKGISEDRIRKVAPDLLRTDVFRRLIGEDRLGMQVTQLKEIIAGGKAGPNARAAAASLRGDRTTERQLGDVIEGQKRFDAIPAPAVPAPKMPEPERAMPHDKGQPLKMTVQELLGKQAGLDGGTMRELIRALDANTAATRQNTPNGRTGGVPPALPNLQAMA